MISSHLIKQINGVPCVSATIKDYLELGLCIEFMGNNRIPLDDFEFKEGDKVWVKCEEVPICYDMNTTMIEYKIHLNEQGKATIYPVDKAMNIPEEQKLVKVKITKALPNDWYSEGEIYSVIPVTAYAVKGAEQSIIHNNHCTIISEYSIPVEQEDPNYCYLMSHKSLSEDWKEPEVSQEEKKKLEDWEYMLKSAIYISLIGYSDSNHHSIPCAVRGQIEESILLKFKKNLREGDYNIIRKK